MPNYVPESGLGDSEARLHRLLWVQMVFLRGQVQESGLAGLLHSIMYGTSSLGGVNCFYCRTKLNFSSGRKLLDFNRLSPIGLLPGVSLAWSCC